MKKRIGDVKPRAHLNHSRKGFTLVEVIVGATIMLLVVLATLSLYVSSNKLSVDQQQFADLQHDVRSAMFFISRDTRSAGVGMIEILTGYYLEGTDGFGPSPEGSDYLKIMGSFDSPLNLRIESYSGGGGGGAATAFLYDWELEQNPYTTKELYQDREVLIMSTLCPGCFAFRSITDIFGLDGTGTGHFNMSPGKSELNPPGGLIDTGCAVGCWQDAIVTWGQIKQYWLDTTGNPGDYPSLNLTVGVKGYLGIPYTLYLSTIDDNGYLEHMALAMNIENLQFQFIGDLDNDGVQDAPADWDNTNWTILPGDDSATRQTKMELISRIRMIRIWVLGRTPNPYVSVSGTPSTGIHLYRRPSIANSPAAGEDDRHRRFLLESTSNIRNLSLGVYNAGVT